MQSIATICAAIVSLAKWLRCSTAREYPWNFSLTCETPTQSLPLVSHAKQKLSWLSTTLWRITGHPKTWAPVKQQHLMDRAPQILGIRDASQNEHLQTTFITGSSGRGRDWGQNAADSKKPRKFHLNYRGILLESMMPHLGAKHPNRCETPRRNFVLKCNMSLTEKK